MSTAIVIPARYGSSRFPGKPLAPIRGRSMLQRVWRIARAVQGVDSVVVATDDERIAEHARGFGADVAMTSPDCRNGTERVAEAVRALRPQPDAAINLQGDAVLTPPWVVQALADALRDDAEAAIVTPAVHCSWAQYDAIVAAKRDHPASGTLVTFDRRGYALYFSKSVIPYLRTRASERPPVYRHIGLYGYRRAALDRLVTLPATPLEEAEQLEQLRALEHGLPIRVVEVDYRNRTHWSVDSPADIAQVEAIIDREGELVAG